MSITRRKAKAAAEAHTNLTMFGAIQSLCESGCFYGGRVHPALDKIIKICKTEQRKELKIMDKEIGAPK